MKWFRMYVDIIDDEKIAAISDKSFKIFTFLMALCSQNDHKSGLIPDEKILPWRFRMSESKIKKAIDELESYGMVIRSNSAITITNWNKRQFKSDDVNARVEKFRGVTKDKSETLQETLQETPPEQNRTDTEQIQNRIEHISVASKTDKLKKSIQSVKEEFDDKWKKNLPFYKEKYPSIDLDFQWENILDWINRKPKKAKESSVGDLNLFFQRWLNKEKPSFNKPKQKSFGGYTEVAVNREEQVVDPVAEFVNNFPVPLLPISQYFNTPEFDGKLLELFKDDGELLDKLNRHLKQYPKSDEMLYRKNYLYGKYGIPEVE
jgi:hypothetical protein